MRKFSFLIVFLMLSVLLCSCGFDESDNSFRGGELLDNEKMSELKDKFITDGTEEDNVELENSDRVTEKQTEKQTDKSTEKPSGSKTETQTERNDVTASTEIHTCDESDTVKIYETETEIFEEQTDIVYWTKSGSVWHVSDQCRYIKNSKGVLSGSVEEAMEAGKEKVCSSCGK